MDGCKWFKIKGYLNVILRKEKKIKIKDNWFNEYNYKLNIQNLTQFVNKYFTILENTKFYISKSFASWLSAFSNDTILAISSLNFSSLTRFVNYFYNFSNLKLDFTLIYINITNTI